MGLLTKDLRSFDKDLRKAVEAESDSLQDPVWESDGVTVAMRSGHRLRVRCSEDGVFFDMVVASAAELAEKYCMTPKDVYLGFGFITPSSFAMRGDDEIYYASAFSVERYSYSRLRSMIRRFAVMDLDFGNSMEEWKRRIAGDVPE